MNVWTEGELWNWAVRLADSDSERVGYDTFISLSWFTLLPTADMLLLLVLSR